MARPSSREAASAASLIALPRVASRASRAGDSGSPVTAGMIPLAPGDHLPAHGRPGAGDRGADALVAAARAPPGAGCPLATSLAGLGFLVAALRSEGLRETALTSLVLVGPATSTAHATAGASLYYYVLTGFCLLLGFAGLIASDRLARWLRPRVLLTSATVAWLATVVRALLEKSAAPTLLVEAVGVTWLAPVAGAYMAIALEPRRSGPGALLPDLLRYAYLVRVPVAAVGIVATRLAAGTHYDVSPLTEVAVAFSERGFSFAPGSWPQLFWLTLLPQLVIWPALHRAHGYRSAARSASSSCRRRARQRSRGTCSVKPPAWGCRSGRKGTRAPTPGAATSSSAHLAVGLALARAAAAAAVGEGRADEARRALVVARATVALLPARAARADRQRQEKQEPPGQQAPVQ